MSDAPTDDDRLWRIETRAMGAGAASGFVAGIAMGVIIHLGTDLLPVLGALAGAPSALRGWVIHLVVSVLYGVLFAIIVAYPLVQRLLESVDIADYAFGGIVYAAMIMGAGAAGTIAILPFLLELPWVATADQSSNVPGPELVGLLPAVMFGIAHVVYGAILGTVYAMIGETPD